MNDPTRDHRQYRTTCPGCGYTITIEDGDPCPWCEFDFDEIDECEDCGEYVPGSCCCGDCEDEG
jgi:rRNA maturation endonuclease Nob1